MHTVDLVYIDKKYTINFSVNTYLDVMPNGVFNHENFKRVILNSVSEFGRNLSMPEAFFVMSDGDFDEFLINIATRLYTILFNFYISVDATNTARLVGHKTNNFYKLKGYNQHQLAIEALEPAVEHNQEVVWGSHDLLLREFSYIS